MFVKKESKSISIVWGDISDEEFQMSVNVGIKFWSLDKGVIVALMCVGRDQESLVLQVHNRA